LLENRINHRLKAKDVLTVAQKKELLHLLFIASHPPSHFLAHRPLPIAPCPSPLTCRVRL
ncbi:MAG: hypothetical protein PVH26_12495, partial [Desulfosarcina sp.]